MEDHHVRELHLVLDNLNTHSAQSLGRVWGPRNAQRFFSRVTFHFTPLHASWLNMAEIEIGCLKRQGVRRRIGTPPELRRVAAGIVHSCFSVKRAVEKSPNAKKSR